MLFEKLTRDLQALIDPQQDSVLIYALCGACAARRLALGLAASQTPPGEEEVFIA